MKVIFFTLTANGRKFILINHYLKTITINAWQGTLVPKLTLSPFLTLSVRNGHTLKDCGFRIPVHIEGKSR